VRYLSLTFDPRELLVPVFRGIAQPRFGDTHNAPASLIGVRQLMRKDRFQLANNTIRARLKKLFGLVDAYRILGIERIGLL